MGTAGRNDALSSQSSARNGDASSGSEAENGSVVVEFEQAVAGFKQVTLPITSIGEWLFFTGKMLLHLGFSSIAGRVPRPLATHDWCVCIIPGTVQLLAAAQVGDLFWKHSKDMGSEVSCIT